MSIKEEAGNSEVQINPVECVRGECEVDDNTFHLSVQDAAVQLSGAKDRV